MGWMTESTLIPKQPIPIDIKKKSLDSIKQLKEQKTKSPYEQQDKRKVESKPSLFGKKIQDTIKKKRLSKQQEKEKVKLVRGALKDKEAKDEEEEDEGEARQRETERELNMIKKAAEYERMQLFGADEFASSNQLVVFQADQEEEAANSNEESEQDEDGK